MRYKRLNRIKLEFTSKLNVESENLNFKAIEKFPGDYSLRIRILEF